MADDLPSTGQFRLPEDLNTLSTMRDQLGDYLNTLERNTDSVNAWLATNQNDIIVGLHRLNRALGLKDEAGAIKHLKELGDKAGFVLSIQDFGTLADAAFGANSAFVAEAKKVERGIPKRILEDLPEIKMPDPNAPVAVVAPPPPPPVDEEAEKKGKKWWNPGTWFDKSEERAAEARKNSEEEAQRKIEEIKRHWRLVRSELISLQSDRHYYVDSFMDWVGETLAPEKPMTDPEMQRLMEKYQNPQIVIDLAMEDYAQVMDVKANALRERAMLYSKTAALIDEQKIAEFAALLPALFPKHDTVETKQVKDLLLQDYSVASFADMALLRVERRDEQLLLLKTALQLEPEYKLTGTKNAPEIFERVLKEVLAAESPLDSSALRLTIDKLKAGKADANSIISLNTAGQSVFERIGHRFTNELPAMKDATAHVLRGVGAPASGIEALVTDFVQAARARDGVKLGTVLNAVATREQGQAFKGLWNLMFPGHSLVNELTTAAKNTSDLSQLTGLALSAGLLDEFKVATNAVQGDAKRVLEFFNNDVMPDHADFSLVVARRLVATAFANGGLDQLRRELTKPKGWLEQVATGELNFEGRSNWIAALVEPWSSNLVKSNILAEAAANAKDATAKAMLEQMDKNLAGANIRLDDGRILTNLERVANIWYNAESKALHLTVTGTGHKVMDDVTPQAAKEILTHIQRRHPEFRAEYDGLYNPANIDRIVTKQGNTTIYWGNHTGVLNVPDETIAALHKASDYMHVTNPKNGQVHSINLKTVALLQPLEDGTHLLVDKYGEVQVVEGKVEIKAQGDLLNLSGTYFNARNASILSLDPAKGKLEFRAESADFEDLLESAAPGQFFYSVDLSKADFDRVVKSVEAAPAIVTPAGTSLKSLHFNMETLGYLMYTDERETGFQTRRNGPAKKPGFIPVEQDDLAHGIFEGLSKNPALVTVGNVITHKDQIDDAYYHADKQRFYFVLSNDILQVPLEPVPAYTALKKLSKSGTFTAVDTVTVPNLVPNGVGVEEVASDLVNFKRTVLQFHSDANDKTFLVAENDRFFYISSDKPHAQALFNMLEEQGLEGARAATPKQLAWTQKLRDVADALPQQPIKVTQSLTELGREYLLAQVTGKPGENRAMPNPKADFAIAAQALQAGQKFDYPARTATAAKRKPVAPRP